MTHPFLLHDLIRISAAGDASSEEVVADFPELEEADIRACLAFAADRERRLVVMHG